MIRKITVVVLVGIVVAAFVALMWWWFFNRATPIPLGTGAFGSAENRPSTTSTSTKPKTNIGTNALGTLNSKPKTNIGTNALGISSSKDKITNGKYTILSLNGKTIGSYDISRDTNTGAFTLTPLDGSPALTPGAYVLNVDGIAVGDYVATSLFGGQYDFTPFTGLQYDIKTVAGVDVGTYLVTQDSSGTFTVVPIDGSPNLDPGTYQLIQDGNPIDEQVTVSVVDGQYDFTPLAGSQYDIQTVAGVDVGTYLVTQDSSGTFTVVPIDGSPNLDPGTYQLIQDGNPIGDYVVTVDNSGYAFNPTDIVTASSTDLGTTDTVGVSWLSNYNGSAFTPTAINSINNASPSGGLLPNISSSISGGSKSGTDLATALGAAALGAGLSCGAAEAFAWLGQATGIAIATPVSTGAVTGAATAISSDMPRSGAAVQTVNPTPGLVIGAGVTPLLANLNLTLGGQSGEAKNTNTTNTFFSCVARVVAKAALQQITSSVVNWINSGFNGSPAFVTNPTQFFTNVADNAAGQFIKSSALSFLCSPFQLQIKIAIASSYANRNAQSCSLNQVIGNVKNFMNGNFASGGWPGMLNFTTVPTNNPYGAYAYASIGLDYSVQTAKGEQKRQLTLGNGFLDFTKNQNCKPSDTNPGASASRSVKEIPGNNPTALPRYEVCDIVHTTPGHVVAQSLGATQNSTFTELDVAKSFDEIIGALITQLVTRTLQQGLSNLSGNGGYESNFYTPDQLQAQSGGQALMAQMQNDTQLAQSYGGVAQGSISDIQDTQNQLNDLYNCWASAGVAATQSPFTVSGVTNPATLAANNADAASTTILQLNAQVDAYNNTITNINSTVTILVGLQSRALSAASVDDLAGITQDYNTAKANGQILTADNLTTAQQNRTTLQSQLAQINQRTAIGLAQCNAFHP